MHVNVQLVVEVPGRLNVLQLPQQVLHSKHFVSDTSGHLRTVLREVLEELSGTATVKDFSLFSGTQVRKRKGVEVQLEEQEEAQEEDQHQEEPDGGKSRGIFVLLFFTSTHFVLASPRGVSEPLGNSGKELEGEYILTTYFDLMTSKPSNK